MASLCSFAWQQRFIGSQYFLAAKIDRRFLPAETVGFHNTFGSSDIGRTFGCNEFWICAFRWRCEIWGFPETKYRLFTSSPGKELSMNGFIRFCWKTVKYKKASFLLGLTNTRTQSYPDINAWIVHELLRYVWIVFVYSDEKYPKTNNFWWITRLSGYIWIRILNPVSYLGGRNVGALRTVPSPGTLGYFHRGERIWGVATSKLMIGYFGPWGKVGLRSKGSIKFISVRVANNMCFGNLYAFISSFKNECSRLMYK